MFINLSNFDLLLYVDDLYQVYTFLCMCHGVMAAACGLFTTLGSVVYISRLCITKGVCECQVCVYVCHCICVSVMCLCVEQSGKK